MFLWRRRKWPTIFSRHGIWWIRTTTASITKIREENLKNREHVALTYATKQDVKDDLQQIMGRFDRLEDKIDDYMRMDK